jgi:hypothetical protein
LIVVVGLWGWQKKEREEIEKEEEVQGREKKRAENFGFLFFKLTLFAWVGKIATCLNFRD